MFTRLVNEKMKAKSPHVIHDDDDDHQSQTLKNLHHHLNIL